MARRQREFSWDPAHMAEFSTVGSDPARALEAAELLSLWRKIQGMVADAVDSLESPYREVIEGVYWEQATLDELAVRLKVAHRSTVMRWRRVGEAKLKVRLEECGCSTTWSQFCEARTGHGRR